MARSTPAWRTVAMLATMTNLYTLPAGAQAARPRIVINDVTVPFEAGGGSSVATFTISFADATSHGVVTVSVSTTPGTATSGSSCASGVDFVGVNAFTVTFSATQQTQQLPITVCGDGLDENDETFTVLLSNASGADIQDNQGQATLIDDDPAPSLRVNDITITEGAAGQCCVQRDPGRRCTTDDTNRDGRLRDGQRHRHWRHMCLPGIRKGGLRDEGGHADVPTRRPACSANSHTDLQGSFSGARPNVHGDAQRRIECHGPESCRDRHDSRNRKPVT